MGFSKIGSMFGIGWNKNYDVPTKTDALTSGGRSKVDGGGAAATTTTTPVGAHTKTPDAQHIPYLPSPGDSRDRTNLKNRMSRNAGNTARKTIHQQREMANASKYAGVADTATTEAEVLERYFPLVNGEREYLRNTVFAETLRSASNDTGVELKHLAAVLSLAVRGSPAPVADAARALACLRSIDLAGSIRNPDMPTSERWRPQDHQNAWNAARYFQEAGMLNTLMKISASPKPDGTPKGAQVADQEAACVAAYLHGAAQIAADSGAVVPRLDPETINLQITLHDLRNELTAAGKGVLATRSLLAHVDEFQKSGEQTLDLRTWQHDNKWAYALLASGWRSDQELANGVRTPYGEMNNFLRRGHDQFEMATGNDARSTSQRIARNLAPIFAPRSDARYSAIDSYNVHGSDANHAMGFKDTAYGAIGQGRSFKQGMLAQVKLALKQSGAGTPFAPAPIPCNEEGHPRVTVNAVPAVPLPDNRVKRSYEEFYKKSDPKLTPVGERTVSSPPVDERTVRNLIRLAICNEYDKTKMMPRYSLGNSLDTLQMENVKKELSTWLEGSELLNEDVPDNKMFSCGLTKGGILDLLKRENQPMVPETLAQWATEVGAPDDIATRLPEHGLTPEAPAPGQPDWHAFRKAFTHIRFNDLGATAPDTTHLNRMRPDTEKVCEAITASVTERLTAAGADEQAKQQTIARGVTKAVEGTGSLEKTFKRSAIGKAIRELVTTMPADESPLQLASKLANRPLKGAMLKAAIAGGVASIVQPSRPGVPGAQAALNVNPLEIALSALRFLPTDEQMVISTSRAIETRLNGMVGNTVRQLVSGSGSVAQAEAAAVAAALGGEVGDIARAILSVRPALAAPGDINNEKQAREVAKMALRAVKENEKSAHRAEIDAEAQAERGNPAGSLGKNTLKIAAATWGRAPMTPAEIKTAIAAGAAYDRPQPQGGEPPTAADHAASIARSALGDRAGDEDMLATTTAIIQARLEGIIGSTVLEVVRQATASQTQAEAAAAAAALGGDADAVANAIIVAGPRINSEKKAKQVAKEALRQAKEKGRLQGAHDAFAQGVSNFELGSGMELWKMGTQGGGADPVSWLGRLAHAAGTSFGVKVAADVEVGKGPVVQVVNTTSGFYMLFGSKKVQSTKFTNGLTAGIMPTAGPITFGPLFSRDTVKDVKTVTTRGAFVRQERKGGVGKDDVTAAKMARNIGVIINPDGTPLEGGEYAKITNEVDADSHLKRLLQDDPQASIGIVTSSETTVSHKKKSRAMLGMKVAAAKLGLMTGVDREGTQSAMVWKEEGGRIGQEFHARTSTAKIAFTHLAAEGAGFKVNTAHLGNSQTLQSIVSLTAGLMYGKSTTLAREGGTIKSVLCYKDGEAQGTSFRVDDNLTAAAYVDAVLRDVIPWAGEKAEKYENGKNVSPEEKNKLIAREANALLDSLEISLKNAEPTQHFQLYYEINKNPLPNEQKSRLEQLRDADRTIKLATLAGDSVQLEEATQRREALINNADTWKERTFTINMDGSLKVNFDGLQLGGVKFGTDKGAKTSHISTYV
jgi:hypothetical protein